MVVLDLICDGCQSRSIIETREGYVCQECGLVLDLQKMEYHRPYEDAALQHAVAFSSTQIGLKKERCRSPHSEKFNRFSKLDAIKENEQAVRNKARIEISRILMHLQLPSSYKELVFAKFIDLRAKLRPGTKYRNFEKLIPICVYLTLKLCNASVNKNELLTVSKISQKEFNAFMLQIKRFIPQYVERNRKKYVEQKILELTEHFTLGMPFFYQAKKLMLALWEHVKNTKDEVIAGLVTSMVILHAREEKVSISRVCDHLCIRMSTIHSQVRKLLERFKIKGFQSLVKSAGLMEELWIQLTLIE